MLGFLTGKRTAPPTPPTEPDTRPTIIRVLAEAADRLPVGEITRPLVAARAQLAEYDDRTRQLNRRMDELQDEAAVAERNNSNPQAAERARAEWRRLSLIRIDRLRERVVYERDVRAAESSVSATVRRMLWDVANDYIPHADPDEIPDERVRRQLVWDRANAFIETRAANVIQPPPTARAAFMPSTVLEALGSLSVSCDDDKSAKFGKGERFQVAEVGETAAGRLLSTSAVRIVSPDELPPVGTEHEPEPDSEPEPAPSIADIGPDTPLTISPRAVGYSCRHVVSGRQLNYRRGDIFTIRDTGFAHGVSGAIMAGVVVPHDPDRQQRP